MPAAVTPDTEPIILGVDPGGTTGYALYRHGGLPGIEREFACDQVQGRFDFYDTFDKIVAFGRPLHLVVEKFTINAGTASKSPQYDALYIIGALERQAWKLGFPMVLQTPTEAKTFGTDAKLKAVGWYTPGKPHGVDAARHLLRYVIGKRQESGGQELLHRAVAGLGL